MALRRACRSAAGGGGLNGIIPVLSSSMNELSNQEESCKVMSELEAELEKLSSALEERGTQLRDIIKEEKRRKEAELQV